MIAAAATVLTLFLAKQTAAADEYVFINTAEELAQLSGNVNSGRTTYSGTTVLLNADLDFNGVEFYPIGKSSSYHFQGVFDGQGYTISNLNMQNYDFYSGLFSYSEGLTVQNVVIDSSCSFESTYTYAKIYIGGIIGYSYTTDGKVTIDNCVNMASISYNKYVSSSSYPSYLGGIVGYHYPGSYPISITNCANYGEVTRTDTYRYNYIGGIAGSISSSSSSEASIVNCINYGTVSVPASYYSSSSYNYMGGIVGYNSANEISNCLSVGEIQTPSSVPYNLFIGSITGYSYDSSEVNIDHCVWSSGITGQEGFGNTFSSASPSDCYDVKTVNETTMDDMNDYVTDGSKWVLSESSPVSLEVSGRKAIVYNANAILLFNSFTNAAGTYSGWYTDSDCTNLLESSITTQTTLYGKWTPASYTATFVFWRGYNETKTYKYGDFIDMLTIVPEREYSTFVEWDSDYATMPLKDITITAVWNSVPFYVTFNPNNGEEPTVEIYSYNETIEYPDVHKTGYKLLGWDNYVEYMPDENITVTAQWEVIYYTATFIFWEDNEETKTYKYGDTIEPPTTIPERVGYVFNGWDSEYATMPAENITVRAQWETIYYYLTFDLNLGEEPIVEVHTYNEVIVYPDVSRTGYEFLGWDKDITNMPAENITITAKWEVIYYTATFIIWEDNEETKTYKYGDTIKPPTVPEREHYVFNGWDSEIETMPPRNITFTAQWEAIKYQIIFNLNNGDEPKEKIYEYDEPIKYPDVTRTGYELLGWDKNITNMPGENVTVTALWKIVYYTATFVDEDTNETKTYFYGNTIKYPEPAGKEGYEFVDWYPHPTTMPAQDTEFIALYKKAIYTVFFVFGDEELDKQEQFKYNASVRYPEPRRTGYEFIEWDKNITYMPAENVTVTALWEAIDYTLTFFEEDNQVIAVQTLHYEDPVFYPEVATKGTRKFDGWSDTYPTMPANDVNITVRRKDIPTSQVKVTAKTDDKDYLEKMIDALTDKPFRLETDSKGGVTTGVVYFDDEVAAEAFIDKVLDELGEGSDAEIVCEYNYYEGYDEKTHRDRYTASGAASLVVSVAALFLAL